ncbi:biopolymer transporter ExbD [Hymenobacter aerilatus]|uniref:Biopolymer transporter ExbD n=1 Tax=Hymenobacter aerilatus TaxID=2932251 RepID=A0A8T9SYW6_9BACT|nr:biopolymer transporter ExbD [Hymenobacter aerilatus]UOR05006.1 biopolymer transporter ExbD [Hymenobacter aerilatus]
MLQTLSRYAATTQLELVYMKRRRLSTNHRKIRLDMTAMVGLAFLLLAFFLLNQHITKPSIRQLNMPAKRHDGEEQNDFWHPDLITLILSKSGSVYYYYGLPDTTNVTTIYSAALHSSELHQVLLDHNAHALIFIKNTSTATYRDLVAILDEMHKTQQRRYVLADMIPEDYALLAQNDL